MVKQLSEESSKKDVMRNFAKFTRKRVDISFVVFSYEFCKICENIFFRRTALVDCY